MVPAKTYIHLKKKNSRNRNLFMEEKKRVYLSYGNLQTQNHDE